MLEYKAYNDHLATLTTTEEHHAGALDAALGHGPMTALRASRPVAELRAVGSFFTSPVMAQTLWSPSLGSINERSRIIDPAVGAGDLLLPPARILASLSPVAVSQQISGTDVDQDFLTTAKRRVQLITKTDTPNFRIHDFFHSVPHEVNDATHVVMNPPFFKVGIDDHRWKSTTVNAAAVFVERALEQMATGSRLLCILPEVLRSGSRYRSWRERISATSEITRIEAGNQFDARTDVHIFFFEAVKTAKALGLVSQWGFNQSTFSTEKTLQSVATVQVGAVVPHRHPELGPSVPFASTRELAPWSTIRALPSIRRFEGRLNKGPLVLVRRTSRPGDRHRAQATIYAGHERVAVENHLLVVTPRDQSLASCNRIVAALKRPETSQFLDERIRLRHLTVAAVNEIPWVTND